MSSKSKSASSHPPISQRTSQGLLLDEETEEVTTVKDKEQFTSRSPVLKQLSLTSHIIFDIRLSLSFISLDLYSVCFEGS